MRLRNDNFELTPEIKALSEFDRVVTTTYTGLHNYNSYVVFAKFLDHGNVLIGSFIQKNFLMDEFFYLLTPYFFHFCQFFMYFCILFIKFLQHQKKITKSFSDHGDVFIKVVDFVLGYFDLDIFEFVLENILKTP